MCKVTIDAPKQIDFRGGTLNIVGSSIIREVREARLLLVYEKVTIIVDQAEIPDCDVEQQSLLTSQIVLMSGGPCIITPQGPNKYLVTFTKETEGYIGNLQRFSESIRRQLNRCIDLAIAEQEALQRERDKEL